MSLTIAGGPLSARAPATVNYAIEGPAHKLLMQPFPRRVRAEFAGRIVLDTRAGVLLHESNILPRLYVPEADLDGSAFVATDLSTRCPFKGDASYRSLRVCDRTVVNALWAYPDPTPAAPWLAGYASLYWEAADAWYDEDEQVFGHLTDPYHRVDIRSSSRHVQVLAGDEIIAESRAPLMLTETGLPPRWYLSPDEVRVPLEPTATRTRCPYKGEASYATLRLADGRDLLDACWAYPEPLPESTRIAGRVSLLHDELTTLLDGVPS